MNQDWFREARGGNLGVGGDGAGDKGPHWGLGTRGGRGGRIKSGDTTLWCNGCSTKLPGMDMNTL